MSAAEAVNAATAERLIGLGVVGLISDELALLELQLLSRGDPGRQAGRAGRSGGQTRLSLGSAPGESSGKRTVAAAVDHQGLPGDEVREIRGEEQDRLGDVLRCSRASQGRGDLVPALLFRVRTDSTAAGVRIEPGHTTLKRTPWRPYLRARLLVRWISRLALAAP